MASRQFPSKFRYALIFLINLFPVRARKKDCQVSLLGHLRGIVMSTGICSAHVARSVRASVCCFHHETATPRSLSDFFDCSRNAERLTVGSAVQIIIRLWSRSCGQIVAVKAEWNMMWRFRARKLRQVGRIQNEQERSL